VLLRQPDDGGDGKSFKGQPGFKAGLLPTTETGKGAVGDYGGGGQGE
jgi:hypothetical protein